MKKHKNNNNNTIYGINSSISVLEADNCIVRKISIAKNSQAYKNINIQNIMREIPYEIASRPTVYKIIHSAVVKKYFIKVKDEKDKRKYNLFPSTQVVNEFKEWAKIFKGF